jgi:hypothetical protein
MTKEQALQIKEWRLNYEGGCSWRVLAGLSYVCYGEESPTTINFPEISIHCFENQIYGRDLHNLACEVLNEEFDVDE